MLRSFSRGASVLAALLIASPVPAQPLPLGSRTAAMGGAATAAGRDGAMPYLNPAGFARVKSTTLSLSASLYRYRRAEISPFFFHGEVDPVFGELIALSPEEDNRMVSERFGAFPGAASALWHFGGEPETPGLHHVLALSVIVLRDDDDTFEGDFVAVLDLGLGETAFRSQESFVSQLTDYVFGPTYAIDAGVWRFGVSPLLTYTAATRSMTSGTVFANDTFFLNSRLTSFNNVASLGFQPVLGAQWQATSELHLGMSFAPPSVHLTGTLDNQSVLTSAGPPDDPEATSVSVRQASGEFERRFPMRIQAGLALEQPRAWGVAADFVYHDARADAFVTRGEGTNVSQVQGQSQQSEPDAFEFATDTLRRISMRAGAEIYLNSVWALRFGGYYEPKATADATEPEDVLSQHVDIVGATLGLGLEDQIGETTFGVDVAHGSGSSAALDPLGGGAVREVNASSWTVQAFVGGAIDVGEFADWSATIRDAEQLFSPEQRQLTLADLDWNFRRIATYPELAPLAAQRVTYIHTGLPEFDRVFEKTARIRLSTQTAPVLLRNLQEKLTEARTLWREPEAAAALAELWRGAQAGTPAAPPHLARLPQADATARLMHSAIALHSVLAATGQEVGELPADARQLMDVAKQELVGPDAARLPAVVRGLSQAEADLRAAAVALPGLIAAYVELFDTLQDITQPSVPSSEPAVGPSPTPSATSPGPSATSPPPSATSPGPPSTPSPAVPPPPPAGAP